MKNTFTLVFALLTFAAQAQFTANNLAVMKITSPTPIGNVGIAYPTSIVEYTTAGVAVRTTDLTTVDTFKFVVEERAVAHEGQLNLSSNGRFITAVGYHANPGQAAGTIRAGTKRILRIDANGKVDLTTSVRPSHSFNGVGLRSAISEDGSSYLVNSSAASAAQGVRQITHGTDSAVLFSPSQYRSLGRFGGVVYGSGLSPSKMYSLDAAGVQTEMTMSALRNVPDYTQFLFLDATPDIPGNDLLYVADRNSGIRKFYLNGINWVPVSDSSGLYNTTFVNATGFWGLTGRIEGGKPTLYGVKILTVGGVYTSSHLVKIVDNSARTADWNTTGNEPTATELAATTNLEQFKGLVFTPLRTSVKTVAENSQPLLIKPSLTQDAITIVVTDALPTKVSIFNIAGQQVLTATAQGEHTLNVSALPTGLYIVRTATGATGRFVKQ